jgi:hypothetical protein
MDYNDQIHVVENVRKSTPLVHEAMKMIMAMNLNQNEEQTIDTTRGKKNIQKINNKIKDFCWSVTLKAIIAHINLKLSTFTCIMKELKNAHNP